MNIINVHSQSLCIAGISFNAARGTYIDSSSLSPTTNNGKTYWMLDNSDQTDCTPTKFYIFYNQAWNRWYIGDTLLNSNSISYHFQCTTNIASMNDSNDPSTCLNWQGGDPKTDYGDMVTSGGCGGPALCTTITLSTDAGACSGNLNYVAPNQYVDAEQDYMIYNEKYEAWLCVNDIASYWGCQPITYSWTGGIGTRFKQPFSNGNVQTYNGVQFTCNGAETTTTTTTAAATTTTTNSGATTSTTTPAPTTSTTTTTTAPVTGGGSVCIWGRTDTVNARPTNVGINGLYAYDGDIGTKPSYKKTADASCGLYYYLYYVGNQWRIGRIKGSGAYVAYCGQSDLSQCSKSQWYAVQSSGGGFTVEQNLYYHGDSCPFWNCASISSNGGSSNCRSFNTQIGENTWSNLAGYIWSFNPSTFTWRCTDSNVNNYKACNESYYAATEQGWTDLSGSNVDLTYTFPAGTYQVTCTGTGTTTTYSPTATTSSPTSSTTTTPAPTTSTTTTTTTSSTTSTTTATSTTSTTTTTTKTPSNDPTEPGTPPTTTTIVPTPYPTIPGTAKPTAPTTPPPTDSNGTSKPTTAAPTSQGVTDWTCVRVANMDNSEYDGDWQESGTNDDRRSYTLNGNWLYFLDDTAAGNGKYWVISTVKGSNDFQDVIKGYCEEIDIKDCSGEMYFSQKDTNCYFSNCDTNDGNNSGLGGDDEDASGLDTKWWIIIIVCILLLFCCIIILIICWAFLGKKKKKKKVDDAFGDTVQMNQTYTAPHDQKNIYQDA